MVNPNPFLSYLQQPQAAPRYDALLDVLGRGQRDDGDYSGAQGAQPSPNTALDVLRRDEPSMQSFVPTRSDEDIRNQVGAERYLSSQHRNNARIARLREQLGLGPDRGDISQSDLEAEDQALRDQAFSERERVRQADMQAATEAQRRAAQNAEDIYNRPGQALQRQQKFAADAALARIQHPDTSTFSLGGVQPTPTPYGVDSTQPRDVTAQARAMQAARSGVPAPTAMAGADDEWGGRFEKYTAGMDERTKSSLRAILKYQEQVPSGSTARKAFEPLVGIAMQVDPKFDISLYEARQKAQNNLSSGETMQKIRALNALAGHSLDLQDIQKNLNNWNIGAAANPFINWLKQKTIGYSAPSEFDKVSGLITGELGKLLAGSAATNELRESISGGVNSGSSDAMITGNIRSTADLARQQWEALLSEVQGLPRSEALQHMLRQQLTPAAWKFLEGTTAVGSPANGAVPGKQVRLQNGGTATYTMTPQGLKLLED